MSLCPSCGTELDVIAVGVEQPVASPDAAVEIARIQADAAIELERLRLKGERSANTVLEQVVETQTEADVAETIIEADAAAEQPALIAEAVGDVIEEVLDVEEAIVPLDETGDEDITPLADTTVVEPDEEPKKEHFMFKNFAGTK